MSGFGSFLKSAGRGLYRTATGMSDDPNQPRGVGLIDFAAGGLQGVAQQQQVGQQQRKALADRQQLYQMRLQANGGDPNDAFKYASSEPYRTNVDRSEYEKSQPKRGIEGGVPYEMDPATGEVKWGTGRPMNPQETAAAEDRRLAREQQAQAATDRKAYQDAQIAIGKGGLAVRQQNANRPRGGGVVPGASGAGRGLGSGAKPIWGGK